MCLLNTLSKRYYEVGFKQTFKRWKPPEVDSSMKLIQKVVAKPHLFQDTLWKGPFLVPALGPDVVLSYGLQNDDPRGSSKGPKGGLR